MIGKSWIPGIVVLWLAAAAMGFGGGGPAPAAAAGPAPLPQEQSLVQGQPLTGQVGNLPLESPAGGPHFLGRAWETVKSLAGAVARGLAWVWEHGLKGFLVAVLVVGAIILGAVLIIMVVTGATFAGALGMLVAAATASVLAGIVFVAFILGAVAGGVLYDYHATDFSILAAARAAVLSGLQFVAEGLVFYAIFTGLGLALGGFIRGLSLLAQTVARSVVSGISASLTVKLFHPKTTWENLLWAFLLAGVLHFVIEVVPRLIAALRGRSPGHSTVHGIRGTLVASYDAMNPGPLGDSVDSLAATFSGGRYSELVTTQDVILYRVHTNLTGHGNGARELGAFWSLEKPGGSLQAQIDLALLPEWGNTATHLTIIRVPAGTTMYVGEVGSQGGIWVGRHTQVLVKGGAKPDWIVGRELLK